MPLRLAFSAWAMRDLPPDQQIEIVRRAGYVGICLVSDQSAPLDAVRITTDERRQLRTMLDDAGLALTAIAGHANILVPYPDQRRRNMARSRSGLVLAAYLLGA